MKNLIIISGDLAAGKSTLADALSNHYKMVSVKKDTIKEMICDEIGYKTREENRALSIASVKLMLYFFEQSALVGDDLILEANFRSDELKELKSLCDKYNYHPLLIVLTGDKKVLYERFMSRLPSRHFAHKSIHLEESFEKYSEYIDSLREQDFVFPIHQFDVTNTDEDELLNQIKILFEQEGIKK